MREKIRKGASLALLLLAMVTLIFAATMVTASNEVVRLGNTSGGECQVSAHYSNGTTEVVYSTTNSSECEFIAELPETMEEHETHEAKQKLAGLRVGLAGGGLIVLSGIVSPNVKMREAIRQNEDSTQDDPEE
jgi:hypothetical protein